MISITKFFGEVPKFKPEQLPDGFAQRAENCDFGHGDLRGIREPSASVLQCRSQPNTAPTTQAGTAISNARSLFADGVAGFVTQATNIDAIRSPVDGDTHKRYYATGTVGGLTAMVTMSNETTGSLSRSGDNAIGVPLVNYYTGVPKPLFVPTVKTEIDTDKMSALKWKIYFFYELDGQKYQNTLWLNTVDAGFTPPSGFSIIEAANPYSEFTFTAPVADLAGQSSSSVSASHPATGVQAVGYLDADGLRWYFQSSGPAVSTLAGSYVVKSVSIVPDGTGQTITWSAGGTQTANAATILDVAGTPVDVRSAIQQANETTSRATPGEAIPCLLLEAYDSTKNNALALSVYSSGSSFSSGNSTSYISAGLDVALVRVAGTDNRMKATLTWGIAETRVYVLSYVNIFDEMGPPSDPVSVDVRYIDKVLLGTSASWHVVPDPANPGSTINNVTTPKWVPFKSIRIDRSNTGSSGVAAYQFVADSYVTSGSLLKDSPWSSATPVWPDTVKAEALGEVLPSWDATRTGSSWEPPPTDLQGLCLGENGICAGYRTADGYTSEIRLCEPRRPWAWPRRYAYRAPSTVLAIKPYSNGFIALTTTGPWLLVGSHPDAMADQPLHGKRGLVAKRAVTTVDDALLYASNDGIVAVRGGQVETIGSALYTRDAWRQENAANFPTMEMCEHDGWVLCYGNTNTFTPFFARLDEGVGSIVRFTGFSGKPYLHCVTLPNVAAAIEDAMYFTDGSYVYRFAGGTNTLAWVWKSKEHVLPLPINFAAGKIRCSGSVTVKIYADGALLQTEAVTGDTTFRVASGEKATKWSVELDGAANSIVYSLHIAETMAELKQV